MPESVAAAVVTRAQAEKAKTSLRALSVPMSQFDTLDIDSLQRAKKEDTSLKKLWSYAQETVRLERYISNLGRSPFDTCIFQLG